MKRMHLRKPGSFLLAIVLFFTACSNSGFEDFNENALSYSSDKIIDEKEYTALAEFIANSKDQHFSVLKSEGKVDHKKVNDYLAKLFKSKNQPLPEIWQAGTTAASGNFNINIYLENSASMDGYVKGVTAFETAIYNLLGDFTISGMCDTLNLNYINKSIPYSKKNASAADIEDFIEKLEPSGFKARGGDRSVSDLKNILSTVLNRVDENNVAVLISDLVFSPGNKNNAHDYLNNQSVGIKLEFADKIRSTNLSGALVQLESDFDGLYYDKNDNPITLKGKRPYYIWLLGNTQKINAILDKKILDNIKGGYLNRFFFESLKQTAHPDFRILFRPRIGEFNPEGGMLNNAVVSEDGFTKGQFGFHLAANFGRQLQGDKYFLDTSNYKLSNQAYSLKIESITNRSDASLSGFTHLLKLETSDLRNETLKIEVIGKAPGWVYQSSSDDDANIAADETEQRKTFGLKYLVEGVSDALYPGSAAQPISSIDVTIRKK